MTNFNVSPVRFVVFLASISIIAIIVFFVGLNPSIRSRITNPFEKISPFDQQINSFVEELTSSGEATLFVQPQVATLKKTPEEKDRSQQYKLFSYVSAGLGAQYSLDHNPKLRKFLEGLDSYIQENYKDLYKKEDFSVACTDTECGTQNNPPDIQKIRDEIEKSELGLNKDAMVKTLDNAAFSTDSEKDRRFAHYVIVIGLLDSEAKNGNKIAKDIAKELGDYLKSNFADLYSQYLNDVQKYGVKP